MRADVGLSMRSDPQLAAFREAVFRGIWVDQQAMGDSATLSAVLSKAGLDPVEITALAADPAVKDALKLRTQEAVDRGAFGAPTFFVGDQMFWGQDRLDFVREALTQ